jgi:hypothetical protein
MSFLFGKVMLADSMASCSTTLERMRCDVTREEKRIAVEKMRETEWKGGGEVHEGGCFATSVVHDCRQMLHTCGLGLWLREPTCVFEVKCSNQRAARSGIAKHNRITAHVHVEILGGESASV